MSAITTTALGKRYGRRWALRDCTIAIPDRSVVGLVGANGAGKTTLLHLAAGLLEPTAGTIETLGGAPGRHEQLARTGFVAQDAPVYAALSVHDHLRLGARLNPRWDDELAAARIARLGLDPGQRAGRLSGGQRSQLALTLAMAKRPELLLLDEPVASLDPLARREFLQDLMAYAADETPTIMLSSHLLSDIERICDHLIVVARGRVQLAGHVDDLLAAHKLLVGPRRDTASLPSDQHVVHASHTERQTTVLVRTDAPVLDPRWVVSDVGLEDLVLAYMSEAGADEPDRSLAVVRA